MAVQKYLASGLVGNLGQSTHIANMPFQTLSCHPERVIILENLEDKMKVVVAGGGIGGLAAAIALAQDGHSVEIIERSAQLQEVGAGIQISPNGMKVLDHLGITPLIEDNLFEPETLELRTGKGLEIFKIDMKNVAQVRWGERFIQIHRADLHNAMRDRARSLGVSTRPRSQVTGYVREGEGAAVYIDGQDRVPGDLVIAADGIKSVIRSQMLGSDRARFTGNIAWRITTPIATLNGVDLPKGGCVWAGAARHAVTTRIKGGKVVNFVGIVEQDDWHEEGWTISGTVEQALADFGEWDPVLEKIITSADNLHRWALFDRPPLAKWSDGPVALLGDAAHAMLPSMAQGAVQALEDAVVLARCVHNTASVETALSKYFDARIARTSKISARSAANLSLFHKSGFVNQAMAWGPVWLAGKLSQNLIHRQQDWIYGFDPLQD